METNNTIISDNGVIFETDDTLNPGYAEEMTVEDVWASETKTVEEKHEEFCNGHQRGLFFRACAISGTVSAIATAFVMFLALR